MGKKDLSYWELSSSEVSDKVARTEGTTINIIIVCVFSKTFELLLVAQQYGFTFHLYSLKMDPLLVCT